MNASIISDKVLLSPPPSLSSSISLGHFNDTGGGMHLQILLTAVGDGKTQLNGNRLLRQRFSKITAKHIQNGYTGEPKPYLPVPEWPPA
jgi:hypothetical protein